MESVLQKSDLLPAGQVASYLKLMAIQGRYKGPPENSGKGDWGTQALSMTTVFH